MFAFIFIPRKCYWLVGVRILIKKNREYNGEEVKKEEKMGNGEIFFEGKINLKKGVGENISFGIISTPVFG